MKILEDVVSRNIPAAVKRSVRQRCRFGCVICGLPVYHYEHIDDFANVKEHAVENITLLCPNHHQDKTSRRLPRETVRRADKNPHNGKREHTTRHKRFFEGDDVIFSIGGNIFTATLGEKQKFTAIKIGQSDFAAFTREQDTLLLNLVVFDIALRRAVEIVDGELILSTSAYDITMVGPNFTIKPAKAALPVKLNFLDNGVNISSGAFYSGGKLMTISPDMVLINPGHRMISGSKFMHCTIGIVD